MKPSFWELLGDTLLIIYGLWMTFTFTIIAWRGLILWEHRPLAIVEAGAAILITILGVERFIKDRK